MTADPAHLADARRLLEQGLTGAARARLEALVATHPRDTETRKLLGLACSRLRDYAAAATHHAAALDLDPEDPRTLQLLGEALRNLGRHDGAVAPLTRAVALSNDPVARLALAQTYFLARRHAEAEETARALAADRPQDPQAAACLASALHGLGRPEEALDWFRRAAALAPRDHLIAGGLATASNYASGVTPAEIRALHENYGRLIETALANQSKPVHTFGPRPHAPLKPRGGEPLRLGVLSPDFRAHAVAGFLEPALAHLDPTRVELFCYSVAAREDQTTDRFRALAKVFRSVVSLNGLDLARTIAADRIHILIDAGGHTENARLPALELRPAPIQVLYCGYPATTGLRAIDYRITDSLADPPGSEPHSVERLLRLDPCHLIYRPPPNAPATAPSAHPTSDIPHPTFASFSTVLKLSRETVETWSRLLREVPGSRLLLKHNTLRDPRVRDAVTARLVAAGAPAQRLLIEGPDDGPQGLLPHYARAHIALDTFPYCGTTTVCEALLMGVPVIARPGPTTASRTSLSILAAVGISDLAAPDSDSYIRAAAALANDSARLAHLRRTILEAFAASPLRDERAFARRFTDALHDAWGRACTQT